MLRRRTAIIAAIGILLLYAVFRPRWNQQLMTSAMYNYAYHLQKIDTGKLADKLRGMHRLLYYKDGLTATVTVTKSIQSGNIGITVNGKYDGSTSRDMANQRLLAHAPLLVHPNPQSACVIGMGTGCTAGSASLYPLKELNLVEIEPAMVEGARFFAADNHEIHENKNVHIKVTDGRLYLRLHPEAFDVIISEPSNPWLAGSSDLFTSEFFKIAAEALRDDGLFCQWIQIYSLSSENLKTLIRTFTDVFPYTYLLSSRPDVDLLLLGSKTEITPDFQLAALRMQDEAIRRDLADSRVGIRNVYDFAARFRMGPKEVKILTGPGPLHTDDRPIIAYSAPKELYINTDKANMRLLARYAVGVAPYIQDQNKSEVEKNTFLNRLAIAYQSFLPGGQEARISRQMAEQSSAASNEK